MAKTTRDIAHYGFEPNLGPPAVCIPQRLPIQGTVQIYRGWNETIPMETLATIFLKFSESNQTEAAPRSIGLPATMCVELDLPQRNTRTATSCDNR